MKILKTKFKELKEFESKNIFDSRGFFRELFGAGKLLGYEVIPSAVYDFGYTNNGIMILPIASIFLIGIFIWIQRSFNKDLIDIS